MRCEAPIHAEGCDGIGSTKDHFTARSIAKLLGWTPKQINDRDNLQWLSPACHVEKDRTTPARKALLEAQLSGAEITFDELSKVESPNYQPPMNDGEGKYKPTSEDRQRQKVFERRYRGLREARLRNPAKSNGND